VQPNGRCLGITVPYVRWMTAVFHVLNTHGKALGEAGGTGMLH
jgi:hypothetical protein